MAAWWSWVALARFTAWLVSSSFDSTLLPLLVSIIRTYVVVLCTRRNVCVCVCVCFVCMKAKLRREGERIATVNETDSKQRYSTWQKEGRWRREKWKRRVIVCDLLDKKNSWGVLRSKRRKGSKNGLIEKANRYTFLHHSIGLRFKMNAGSRHVYGTNLIHFYIFPLVFLLVFVFVLKCAYIVGAVD